MDWDDEQEAEKNVKLKWKYLNDAERAYFLMKWKYLHIAERIMSQWIVMISTKQRGLCPSKLKLPALSRENYVSMDCDDQNVAERFFRYEMKLSTRSREEFVPMD